MTVDPLEHLLRKYAQPGTNDLESFHDCLLLPGRLIDGADMDSFRIIKRGKFCALGILPCAYSEGLRTSTTTPAFFRKTSMPTLPSDAWNNFGASSKIWLQDLGNIHRSIAILVIFQQGDHQAGSRKTRPIKCVDKLGLSILSLKPDI